MKSIISDIRLQFDNYETPELVATLKTPKSKAQNDISELQKLLSAGKQLKLEIKQHYKKRSLDSNSYCWLLISKIAEIIQSPKEEVYIEMLKRYGQREEQLLSVIAEGVPAIMRATNNHCTEVGESWLNGKLFKHLAILIGSSQYSSLEMSILIDGIVQDAKELGIEVMTEIEIKSMLDSWNKKG